MCALIYQESVYANDTKATNDIVSNTKKAEVTKVGSYKKRIIGGYSMILFMNSSMSPKDNHNVSSKITYENSLQEGKIKSVNLRGRLSDENLSIPIKISIFNVDDEKKSSPLIVETLHAIEHNEDILTIDLTDYEIELPENGIWVEMEILGLLDAEMNDHRGTIVLNTGRRITDNPKSFLNSRPFKTRPFKKGSHRFYNIGCWLEVES